MCDPEWKIKTGVEILVWLDNAPPFHFLFHHFLFQKTAGGLKRHAYYNHIELDFTLEQTWRVSPFF